MRMSRHRRQRQRGQALVEMALSLLVLILLVSGAAQIGVIYYTLLSVDSAARESARVASENPGNTGVTPNGTGAHACTPVGGDPLLACKAAVNSTHNGVLGGLVDPQKLDVNLSWVPFPGSTAAKCRGAVGTSDGVVTVAVSYNAPIFLPIVGPIFATGTNPYRTVTGTETIRVEPCDNTSGG